MPAPCRGRQRSRCRRGHGSHQSGSRSRNRRSSPCSTASRPVRRAISRNSAKCGDGSSSAGGTHISPTIGRSSRSRQSRTKASAASGMTPDFCGSSPVLTSIRHGSRRPVRSISRAKAIARRGRSTVSITSNKATASLTLLVCNGPIRCRARSGNDRRSAGYFASASCTRFSPNSRWPAASASRIAAAGWVLLTATSAVLPGGRPAPRAAASTRACTAARLSATTLSITPSISAPFLAKA